MIQERVYPTFLKKVTPGPKLWLALGLILSLILVKNTYYAITYDHQHCSHHRGKAVWAV